MKTNQIQLFFFCWSGKLVKTPCGFSFNILANVCVVCVPMPTHCTITCFGFHARWIDGIKCGLFSNHAPLGQYLYSVREKVEVGVTVSVTVCGVLLCCVGWWWKEGRRWNPVPAHSLLFSKSTKRAAKVNVPIRRTNRYQQYYMPSQHTYCGLNSVHLHPS